MNGQKSYPHLRLTIRREASKPLGAHEMCLNDGLHCCDEDGNVLADLSRNLIGYTIKRNVDEPSRATLEIYLDEIRQEDYGS